MSCLTPRVEGTESLPTRPSLGRHLDTTRRGRLCSQLNRPSNKQSPTLYPSRLLVDQRQNQRNAFVQEHSTNI